MMRTAHYVASTHWDREWYDSFQGFRMRLVSLLDEVIEVMEREPDFRSFVMDGQVAPVCDYLEIRSEKREMVERLLREGRLKIGPWYVLPDEWLVSGESIVRNLQEGMRLAAESGAQPSRAGFLCDMFGHIGQMPQIFGQMGVESAFIWRGLNEKDFPGLLNWKAPDGTVMPSYRFGAIGYCSYAIAVRDTRSPDSVFLIDDAVGRLVEFTLMEARRTPRGPILLFDGGDHLEIEPLTPELIARANKRLAEKNIVIVHSDLDAYSTELGNTRHDIGKTVIGELRETGRDPVAEDEQWLIPGVLSSRIHLKQKNAQCEDELCLWAEPFAAFLSTAFSEEYPAGYLRRAWKHLLENHPHDSMCGCSIDQVHEDMLYRFDQSYGIASRLAEKAMKTAARRSSPLTGDGRTFSVAVFNPTAETVTETVDIEIPLPVGWPVFKEFFGFEDIYTFRLKNADGNEIPYQRLYQKKRMGYRVKRTKFPVPDERRVVGVAATLTLPACGYTTVIVEPATGPVRFSGSLMTSRRSMENDHLAVEVSPNGTIAITDKQTGRRYEGLLTFEDRADIGDGWYHGIAVNDIIHSSEGASADIAVVADGSEKAVIRIALTMHVPRRFDFHTMTRDRETAPFCIVSDITLRRRADRVEIETTVDNTILDHRLRVLFPTGTACETYFSDSCYDVVERPVALAPDNDFRRELDVETRPQITWTAAANGKGGLAVVSRGLPESAVMNTKDRPIALTLLRGFRRAVLSDDNEGGQIQGRHAFRYWIAPFSGNVPIKKLFLFGQRINSPSRAVDIQPWERASESEKGALPPVHSFLALEGKAVATSIQNEGGKLLVRLFNPSAATEKVTIRRPVAAATVACVTLDGRKDTAATVVSNTEGVTELLVPPKRIATVFFDV